MLFYGSFGGYFFESENNTSTSFSKKYLYQIFLHKNSTFPFLKKIKSALYKSFNHFPFPAPTCTQPCSLLNSQYAIESHFRICAKICMLKWRNGNVDFCENFCENLTFLKTKKAFFLLYVKEGRVKPVYYSVAWGALSASGNSTRAAGWPGNRLSSSPTPCRPWPSSPPHPGHGPLSSSQRFFQVT